MDLKGNAITVVNLLQEWTSKLPIHLAAYSAKDLLVQMTVDVEYVVNRHNSLSIFRQCDQLQTLASYTILSRLKNWLFSSNISGHTAKQSNNGKGANSTDHGKILRWTIAARLSLGSTNAYLAALRRFRALCFDSLEAEGILRATV